jgi:Phospholipase_D-nuclease N-terminal
MELLLPDVGLIVWSLLALINIVLLVTAIVKLANNKQLSSQLKVVWIMAIVFVPIVGALLFFVKVTLIWPGKRLKKAASSANTIH